MLFSLQTISRDMQREKDGGKEGLTDAQTERERSRHWTQDRAGQIVVLVPSTRRWVLCSSKHHWDRTPAPEHRRDWSTSKSSNPRPWAPIPPPWALIHIHELRSTWPTHARSLSFSIYLSLSLTCRSLSLPPSLRLTEFLVLTNVLFWFLFGFVLIFVCFKFIYWNFLLWNLFGSWENGWENVRN